MNIDFDESKMFSLVLMVYEEVKEKDIYIIY